MTYTIPTLTDWLSQQPQPEPKPRGKLTAEQRRDIRIFAGNGMSPADLAVKYEVSTSTIFRIINY